MLTHDLHQGSPQWHAYRASHDNASDAPAMLGCSTYKTRNQLLAERATGITPEVDAATQRLFDSGHRFEALARPLAEAIIGQDLYPCTGSLEGSRLSASFDGLTMLEDVAFEHKRLNARLRAALSAPDCTGADLPIEYQIQMEQQCAVSGCEKILFMASAWDSDDQLIEELHCWYTPNPALRARILAGWEQFEREVAAYVPTEAAAPVVAAPIESLPAVVVQVQGALTVGGNLPAFGEALRAFIARIPQRPENDQEFADAEAACKALKKAEDALEQAENSALAQVSDVELMRRTVKDLKTLARTTRLATEKLVAAEKDARRLEIVQQAQKALIEHVMAHNRCLQAEGAGYLPVPPAGLFAPCIKGLKSLDSMRDKVTAELVAHKVQADDRRDRMLANRASLRREDSDWIFMFPDFGEVGNKLPEDFQALAELRITRHKQAEAERMEKERERIRREEQERADREARDKLAAEESATQASIAQAVQQGELAQPLAADLGNLVTERRAEGVSAIDARQAISAAQASASAADTGETLTLGQLNTLLSPIAISAAGLSDLGFNPCATVKAAKHYPAASVPAICLALIQRLQGVMAEA